jgi:hypothetical protein
MDTPKSGRQINILFRKAVSLSKVPKDSEVPKDGSADHSVERCIGCETTFEDMSGPNLVTYVKLHTSKNMSTIERKKVLLRRVVSTLLE